MTHRVLVSGGSGFIGRHLVPRLQAEGHDVVVWSRSPELAAQQLPANTPCVRLLAELSEQPEQGYPIDTIINLAGERLNQGRWTPAKKQRLYQSRVELTQQLLHWAEHQRTPPTTLISASAIGYYGHHNGEPLIEASLPHDGFSHQLCAQWEAAAKQFERLGCRVCIARFGVVLGHDDGALAQMLPPFRFGLGGRLGDGRQWFSWIHLQDLLDIILLLMNNTSLSGPFNATAPAPVTNTQLTHALAEALHRPAWLPVPAPVLRLLFGEMADELLLHGQRVVPQRLLQQGFEFHYPAINQALADLVA